MMGVFGGRCSRSHTDTGTDKRHDAIAPDARHCTLNRRWGLPALSSVLLLHTLPQPRPYSTDPNFRTA